MTHGAKIQFRLCNPTMTRHMIPHVWISLVSLVDAAHHVQAVRAFCTVRVHQLLVSCRFAGRARKIMLRAERLKHTVEGFWDIEFLPSFGN